MLFLKKKYMPEKRSFVDKYAGFKIQKTENRKNWPYGWIELLYFQYFFKFRIFVKYNSSIQPYGQFFCFQFFES